MSVLGSLVDRARSSAVSRREASLESLLAARDRNGFTHAGVGVTHLNALTNDAVWACARLLVDTISTLPVGAFRKAGQTRIPMPSQPQVVTSPSAVLERTEFVGQVVLSIIEDGNAYGRIVGRDGLGFATQIELRDHADVVVTRKGRTGPPVYRFDGRPVPIDDVFHVRGMTRPGAVLGISAVDAARQTIARGLAAERYGAQWFGDGAHPSAVLQADGAVSEPTAKAIKQRFLDAVRGREPVVLGQGLSYEPIQSDPEKSQLVAVERLVAEKAARFFGIPPEMIGAASSGTSVTYANREQRAQDFTQFSVLPWLVRIENPWSRLLPRPQFVHFVIDGLLRAETKTRYEAHDLAIRGGWRSVNEVRALEDEEPIADGDRYLWPPFATSVAPSQPTGGST